VSRNTKYRTLSKSFDSIWTRADLYRKKDLRTAEPEKLNIMQNEFVNIAAHELRTPTQAIVGYSEILDQSRERSRHYEEASRTAART
jgi:signal transduction histidine kinase